MKTTEGMKPNMAEDQNMDSGRLRVLEFYSGVGGMRYALQLSGLPFIVVEAFDINEVANDVYEHNFGHRPSEGNVSRVNARELDAYRADMWLMAPPCQPYTRQGLKKDAGDGRATSFLAMLQRIPLLQHPPTYILVENVVGFETSITHDELLRTLSDAEFAVQEFILSPLQFGIPYSRPRYFCLAKSKHSPFPDTSLAGTIVRSPAALFQTRPPFRPFPSNPATPIASEHPNSKRRSSQSTKPSGSEEQNFDPPSLFGPATPIASQHPESSMSNPNCAEPPEFRDESPDRPFPFPSVSSTASEHPSSSEPANTSGNDEEGPDLASHPLLNLNPSTEQSRSMAGDLQTSLLELASTEAPHARQSLPPPFPPTTADCQTAEAEPPRSNPNHSNFPPSPVDCQAPDCQAPEDAPLRLSDSPPVRPVSDFLESLSASEFESVRVPEAIVSRWGDAFDIVTPLSTRCCCFTKSYVKFAKGTGSILATTPRGVWQDRHVADEKGIVNGGVKFDQESGRLVDLAALNLRFFTPREVANFHSFPTSFSFPAHVTLKQQYALLGNSLNAELVAFLLSYLRSPQR